VAGGVVGGETPDFVAVRDRLDGESRVPDERAEDVLDESLVIGPRRGVGSGEQWGVSLPDVHGGVDAVETGEGADVIEVVVGDENAVQILQVVSEFGDPQDQGATVPGVAGVDERERATVVDEEGVHPAEVVPPDVGPEFRDHVSLAGVGTIKKASVPAGAGNGQTRTLTGRAKGEAEASAGGGYTAGQKYVNFGWLLGPK